jgi:hypothetical protein
MASPIASCIRDEVVGASPCGQASSTFGSARQMSEARPSVEEAQQVSAMTVTWNRLA